MSHPRRVLRDGLRDGRRARIRRLAVLDIAMGLVLVFGPPERTSNHSFAAARELWPIEVYGFTLLLAGGWLLQAARTNVPAPLWSATATAGFYAFWVGLFAVSIYLHPAAALTGVPVYAYVAWAHLALGTDGQD